MNDREKLILDNIGLVHYLVNKYYCPPENDRFDDYCSIGYIALINAIDTYDEEKGKLSSYASKCILNLLSKMVFEENRIKRKEVCPNTVISVDEDGNTLFLDDILSDNNDLFDECYKKIVLEEAKKIIETLPPNQKSVITRKYFSGKLMSNQKISDETGIPLSSVQYNIATAIHKIKKRINNKDGKLK